MIIQKVGNESTLSNVSAAFSHIFCCIRALSIIELISFPATGQCGNVPANTGRRRSFASSQAWVRWRNLMIHPIQWRISSRMKMWLNWSLIQIVHKNHILHTSIANTPTRTHVHTQLKLYQSYFLAIFISTWSISLLRRDLFGDSHIVGDFR